LEDDENNPDQETAAKSLGMGIDNLLPVIVMGLVGIASLVVVITILLLFIKYVYPCMPKIIKTIIMKIKSKLMWSSALRYTT
jgi:hypothetical protein